MEFYYYFNTPIIIVFCLFVDDGMDGRGKKKKKLVEVRGSQFESEAGENLAAAPGPGNSVFSRETGLKEYKEVSSYVFSLNSNYIDGRFLWKFRFASS